MSERDCIFLLLVVQKNFLIFGKSENKIYAVQKYFLAMMKNPYLGSLVEGSYKGSLVKGDIIGNPIRNFFMCNVSLSVLKSFCWK